MKRQFFAFALLSLLISSCGGNNFPEVPKKIMVTGSSKMEITPDEIYMNFTIQEYKNKAGKKVTIQEVKTQFLDLCKKSGLAMSDIRVAGYSGNENWDYYYWYYRRDTEISSSLSYTIKVKTLSKIDKIVAGLDRNAVENFYLVRTSHSQLEKLRRKVKENAVKASKTKAIYLAKAVGEEVGDALLIQEITEGDVGSDRNYGYVNKSVYSNTVTTGTLASSYSSGSPSVDKIKIRFEVKAEYELD
jgi:uncharacterized protein YggE